MRNVNIRISVIGVLLCLVCIISPLIENAISLDTTIVSNENGINKKNNLLKKVECYEIQSGYIHANAIIESAHYQNISETYISSYYVKSIFFIGRGFILYDDNTSIKLPLMIQNLREPYFIGGKIFKSLTVSDDYIKFNGRVSNFDIFTTPFENNEPIEKVLFESYVNKI
ncbi:Uncharacterised protein [uncultured archaeon]|nr:Uncharacterised protein [uncultured archaeon]